MILLAAMLLMQAPEAGPPEVDFEEIQEITVIAQRLRQISASVGRDVNGDYQCSLNGSTGLANLDDQLCRATTACVRKGKSSDEAVQACVAKARPSLIARIRDYMRAERTGAGA